jgi:hypothetical protein
LSQNPWHGIVGEGEYITTSCVFYYLQDIKPGDNPANLKIALPEDLIMPTVKWYHQVTGHPGSKRFKG